jgi:5'-nucleotidase
MIPSKASPHILVTNDDGIHAAGIRALAEAMFTVGRVTIAAPSQERSAAAQSLTLRRPIYYEEIVPGEWSVDGTPADAMILALHGLLEQKPSLVVSGINYGGNLGENIYYSGTLGAAREGGINGVPSMAISVSYRHKEVDFGPAADLAARLVPLMLAETLPQGVVLNINVPQQWTGEIRATRQSAKITRNDLQAGTDNRGRKFMWLKEQVVHSAVEPGSDYEAIFAGAASITPLILDHTHSDSLEHIVQWAAQLSEALRR